MIPRPTRLHMWRTDDLAVIGDRVLLFVVCVVLLLYAAGTLQ